MILTPNRKHNRSEVSMLRNGASGGNLALPQLRKSEAVCKVASRAEYRLVYRVAR